jgi:asparagine synthase (glutamine-hydrolysing)
MCSNWCQAVSHGKCGHWREARASAPVLAGLAVTRWYHLQPQPFNGSFTDAASQFRELLTDSVRLRLRSDVPVGSCLSGGLDSSSIVCATHRLLRAQATACSHKTFSACSDIKRFDEREFIEKVVAATGVEPHYVFPSLKDLFADLDRVTWHQDEPFAGTSIYAQWCVFKLAAEAKVKVMLDGQGADELLFGYPNFRRAFFCGLLRSGQGLTAWRETLAARGQWRGAFSAFWRASVDTAIPIALQRLFRQFRRNQRPPSWLVPAALGASFPGPLAARFQRHTSARELSLELLSGAHLQMLLHWEDRNSMAQSIESRVPFLDYRLVEFATGLPDPYKIRQGLTKAVLRAGMSELVPPEVLARRDKMGFVTPEEVWARESGVEEFRHALAEALVTCKGIVTPAAMELLEDTIAGRRGYDSAVWRIISLGTWMRRFGVST